ncbi:MAG TPA: SRPBCC family protein [Polyangiaceae bacterium]|jgi:uncharacterized protein YndB with AHSA1/START domain
MTATRSRCHVDAPRSQVYAAILDRSAVTEWQVPDGMTCQVHEFEAHEGGLFRISLTYDDGDRPGKTSGRTDTYHGHFVELVPDERIIEVLEFETTDPAMRGEMTIVIALSDAGGGTDLVAVHGGLPSGVSKADNELGWQMSLAKLKALVEERARKPARAG